MPRARISGVFLTALAAIAVNHAGRPTQAQVPANGAVAVGALPPGDYVVRGTIRLEDGTTGRVVRTLRKVGK